jgi:WD40 repeat protein/serine/threonine protein kinase
MTVSTSTLFCIVCGREFRPRDADTVICPDCGGPPEAPAPSQPQETVLADQPRGTVLMSQPAYQRMCILCGQDFTTPDPQADRCPQCRGEAPQSQPEIRSRPESRQPTPAMPAPAQRTVAMPESGLSPAPSSADVPLTWNAGDVILDLYEVKGELGKGGMGVVYRVHHRQWNIDLAVKTPLPQALQKAGSLENFLREAQAWVDLGLHPHIVTCYYVRRLGEMPRVFAECMEGGSLKNWMEDGRLYAGGEQDALKRILDCAIQFAWGLGYAHEKGLVHQDVKPANALMTPDGMLKVTDFGLVGAKGYTPAYAAPEQELGQAVSPRTDIWGWGVSVLEMFTGGVHWQFGSVAASVLENYLQEAPPEGIPPMPAALAELLRQCFQNDPDQRPASMDEVAERLMRLYEQETGAPYPRPKPQALDMRADSLNNKAVSLLDLGLEEEAVRCWQEALQADPAHLEANFNYGYYRWQKAELLGSEFLKQLQRLESTHGSDPEYWRLLGWVYLEQGYVEEVEEILEKRGVKDEALRRAHTAPDRPVGREVRTFSNIPWTHSVALLPKGQYTLFDSMDGMHLQDVTTSEDLYCLKLTERVFPVAFSSNGHYAISANGRLWEVASGREIRRFKWYPSSGEFSPNASSVAFSPDGRYVLSGSPKGIIQLWDVTTGREVRRFEGHAGEVIAIALLENKQHILSLSLDHTFRVWDVKSGQELNRFKVNFPWERVEVDAIAFHLSWNNCYALSVTRDAVRLWDIKTGREVRCLLRVPPARLVSKSRSEEAWSFSAAFSPDGCYALSIQKQEFVRMWEVRYPPLSSVARYPFPILTRIHNTMELDENRKSFGHLVCKAQEKIVLDEFRKAYMILRQAQNLSGYAREKKLLSLLSRCGANGHRCRLRDAWLVYRMEGHTDSVESVAFSPDGLYALSGSLDKTVRLWDVAIGKEIRCLKGHKDGVHCVAFSPDGRYVLSGSGGFLNSTLLLWEVASGQEIQRFEVNTSWVHSVLFSPDGRYIFFGSNDTIQLWEAATGREVRRFEGHTSGVNSVAFSPDGRYVLSGSLDQTIRLWEVATGQEVRCFEGHTDWIRSVAFSPHGYYLLSGSGAAGGNVFSVKDTTLRLWNAISGQEMRCFKGHTNSVVSVAFSPDGHYVISGSDDMTIRLWEIASGREIHCFKGHYNWVNSVALSPNGQFVLSGSADNTICLWFLDWDYDFPDPADWDEGARPYLDIFLTLHTPYGPDGLRRVGKPKWTEEDFQKLLQELGYRGYGWLRPEGVRRELEKMAKERK